MHWFSNKCSRCSEKVKSLEGIFESDSIFLHAQLAPELTVGRRDPSAPVKTQMKWNSSCYPCWQIQPLGVSPFHSRLSFCNKDLVEYANFWIVWKVLKTSQEQMDSVYVGNELAVSWVSVECPLCLQRSLNFQQFLSKYSKVGIPFLGKGFKNNPSESCSRCPVAPLEQGIRNSSFVTDRKDLVWATD